MVGAMVDVGRGRLSVGQIKEMFEKRERTSRSTPMAPPHGLCLTHVNYARKLP